MKKLLAVCSLLLFGTLDCRVHQLVTDHPQLALQNFNSLLDVNTLAIVFFDPFAQEPELNEIEELKDTFKAVSREGRYSGGDLTFIGINLFEHPAIGKKYGLKRIKSKESTEQEAGSNITIMLFKHGVPYEKKDKKVILHGPFTKAELKNFIEDNFKKRIDKTLELKKERMQVQPEQYYQQDYSSYNYRPYYRPYFYRPYYWGGWGYSPYYWGPGYGFGFGFGW